MVEVFDTIHRSAINQKPSKKDISEHIFIDEIEEKSAHLLQARLQKQDGKKLEKMI